ncbi:MAG: UDPglucose--hexose-phosphate uridylyltransferase [Chloroflexota bacterium]|jgi:UDPglucose--hexose-1-phosphate uridylyltransferase|nr:UDPglucose--hexose-phosphate uridylyltransferase [Chloroflexota bacterium]
MPRGLFELRKDAITGWWVAVVVDREFERRRFARPARHIGQTPEDCPNCDLAAGGDQVQVRTLKADAFIVAGTEKEARELQPAGREPELGMVGDSGSYQTIVAPRGHHESLAETSPQIAFDLLARARDVLTNARNAEQTEYLQVVQNYGLQAGALTDHLCFDFYDLPQIPHRIGEELGGAARFVIREGECPFCRLVRDEVADPARLVYEDSASVCFAPYASRSPFELWVVPRHHAADFGTASDAQLASAADTLQSVLRLLASLGGPAYNLVLHSAPLRERVDDTFHWHWEIHPRLREIAGLEIGTGLPVNPIAPEQVARELLETAREERIETGVAAGPRSWDEFSDR